MKPSFKNKRSGGQSGGWKGGKTFGSGRSPWKSEGADRGNVVMHAATCVECGNSCQVPFKPNGRKPVFCSNCFKKDEQDGPKRFSKPSFGDRPERDGGNIEARLAKIESKLDTLIEMLKDG